MAEEGNNVTGEAGISQTQHSENFHVGGANTPSLATPALIMVSGGERMGVRLVTITIITVILSTENVSVEGEVWRGEAAKKENKETDGERKTE